MTEPTISQSVIGDRNVFTAQGDINIKYELSPAEAGDRRNLLILLNKVKQFWVEGVLKQSIHHEALIQLGKELRPEMVEHPWERVLELPDKDSRLLPQIKKIGDIFDETGRALLIVGEPGSGKTITLLELARELITKAEDNPTQPIPVVLNLSTWTSKQPIFDWLVNELSTKFQIPKRFGRPWLENNRLLLLLDGLDEVAPEHRATSVTAINDFVEQVGLPGLVVCSRLQEYLALPKYLKLSGAICLQPLTRSEIEDYLVKAGPNLASLHAVLQDDPALQELAQTPLMLSVMSIAYKDLTVEALIKEGADTFEGRQQHLFNTYIERMFERKGKTDQPYSRTQTIEWLLWLAQRMAQNSKTVFLLEELQPIWLVTRRQFWIYAFSSRMIFWAFLGLIFGLFYGLIYRPYEGLIMGPKYGLFFPLMVPPLVGLIAGLVTGLMFGLTGRNGDVPPVGTPRWSWSGTLRSIILGLNVGMICGLTFGLIYGLQSGLTSGLTWWLIGGLIFAVAGRRESITRDIRTVETLIWSWSDALRGGGYGLMYSMIAGLIMGLIMGLVFLIFIFVSKGVQNSELVAVLIYMLAGGLAFGFLLGLPVGLTFLILRGLKSGIVDKKTLTNQGISLSMRNAVLSGLIVGLTLGLIEGLIGGLFFALIYVLIKWAGLIGGPIISLIDGLIGGLISGLITGLLAGLIIFGGLDAIKHYVLRLILAWKGYAPLNYARFLDYAAKLIFLRKVGGGYIFIHRMLMEHFAAMEKEESGEVGL